MNASPSQQNPPQAGVNQTVPPPQEKRPGWFAGRSPVFKENLIAIGVIFFTTLIANQKFSAAFVAAVSAVLIVPFVYPILRDLVNQKVAVRIATLVIGGLITFYYLNKYEQSKHYDFTYRVGSVGYDGIRSDATGEGAQSHHGGVKRWLYSTTVLERTPAERRKHSFGIVAFNLSIGILLLIAALLPNIFGLKIM